MYCAMNLKSVRDRKRIIILKTVQNRCLLKVGSRRDLVALQVVFVTRLNTKTAFCQVPSWLFTEVFAELI